MTLPRRSLVPPCLAALLLVLSPLVAAAAEPSSKPIDLGDRRELLIDDFLIARMSGDAKLKLHQPEAREVALVTDQPWEGNTCAYYTVFRDGDLYRMYYRGSHFDEQTKKSAHPEVACYAESKDGIHWTKPNLGLFEFNGSKENNIVWRGPGTHNFTPFKDERPGCPSEQRYKAVARASGGLLAFQSPDGIRWSLMSEKSVITKGAFDSQNLAFWDPHAQVYREYHRIFSNGVRAISTATTDDFLKWPDPKPLVYEGDPPAEHLYTNAIAPYIRAPHLLLGFPTRFQPTRGDQVEPIFMSSRDGLRFRRWSEPLIPVTAPEDRSGNRSNYLAWGLVTSPDNSPRELWCYATEAYYRGPNSRLRRFVWRTDGFVSLSAGQEGGEMISKPLVVSGDSLDLNYAAHDGGSIQVEIQGEDGKPIDGFSLQECQKLAGDEIAQSVSWKGGALKKLHDKPVTMRLVLKNADVYALQFTGAKAN